MSFALKEFYGFVFLLAETFKTKNKRVNLPFIKHIQSQKIIFSKRYRKVKKKMNVKNIQKDQIQDKNGILGKKSKDRTRDQDLGRNAQTIIPSLTIIKDVNVQGIKILYLFLKLLIYNKEILKKTNLN
jgi:hypothetical protein